MRAAVSALIAFFIAVILAATALAGPADASPAGRRNEAIAAAKQLQAQGVYGANDWNCRLTRRHPRPLVLVHGTAGIAWANWIYLARRLKDLGYCTFALEYGHRPDNPFPGMTHIDKSAAQLKVFVDGVLAATGVRKVDLVGHSQGGMMPRWYLRFLGGAAKVNDMVGIAPSNHGTWLGTWFPGLGRQICNACIDQTPGSPLLTRLNRGHEVEPGVDYTVITTKYDELVVPWQGQLLKGPARQLTNVVLQDACPHHFSDHALIVTSDLTVQWIDNALSRPGPADPRFEPHCV